jgi:hypothetical protein
MARNSNPPEVGYGSWPCENTLARDCDSINVSPKAPLGLQVSRKMILFRRIEKNSSWRLPDFSVLHSQGHFRPIQPVLPVGPCPLRPECGPEAEPERVQTGIETGTERGSAPRRG